MAAFLDGCRFNPAAGGTTDWTYASAVTGYQSPAAANAVNGATYSYRAESTDLSQWEMGVGIFNTATGILARTTVLFNSLGTTAKVSFATVPQVAIVALAEDLTRANLGLGTLGHVPGIATNTAAAAGEIGEVISNTSSITFTSSNVWGNVASITLTPGDWDISAQVQFGGAGSNTTSDVSSAISSTSASITGLLGQGSHNRNPSFFADYATSHAYPPQQVTLSTATTYYLVAQSTSSAAGYSAGGLIRARRMR